MYRRDERGIQRREMKKRREERGERKLPKRKGKKLPRELKAGKYAYCSPANSKQ
jgi:hypothetical protein